MPKLKIELGKSGNRNFSIEAQELVTGRSCVIAQSGAGKSYLISVLCEKMLKNKIPFCIIDTEGEYFSLKEKFEILWVGGEGSDVDIEKVNLKELAEKAITENIPIIFDVSDVLEERRFVEEFSSNLYDIATIKRSPYLMIIEEADKFIPQSKDSIKKIEEISRRGRKRGLGLMIATQRPALVNKNVLSQCGNQFIGKLTTENDLKAVNLFFSSRKQLEELPLLDAGYFFAMGNISKRRIKFKSDERETQHKGLTPELIPKDSPKISEFKNMFEMPMEEFHPRKEILKKKKEMKAKVRGFEPIFTDKQKLFKVLEQRRRKKFLLFGEREPIQNLDMIFRPLFYVEIRTLEGLVKKKFKEYSFIMDGLKGHLAEINNGLSFSRGFHNLLGLNETEANILIKLNNSKGKTVSDIELLTGLSEGSVRGALKDLKNKKLITESGKSGHAKLYSTLVDVHLPKFYKHHGFPAKELIVSGHFLKHKIREEDFKGIVKALNKRADVIEFKLFFYPMWRAKLKNRTMYIDGITGKEIVENIK